MASTMSQSQQPSDRVSFKTWIGVFGTILGAFMAVLDIQITNSSLRDIQAALGATLEEGIVDFYGISRCGNYCDSINGLVIASVFDAALFISQRSVVCNVFNSMFLKKTKASGMSAGH